MSIEQTLVMTAPHPAERTPSPHVGERMDFSGMRLGEVWSLLIVDSYWGTVEGRLLWCCKAGAQVTDGIALHPVYCRLPCCSG